MRVTRKKAPRKSLYEKIFLRKQFSFFYALTSVMCLFFLTGCSGQNIQSLKAQGGSAEISDSVDFDRGDLVRLDGEWEFYPGKLLNPEDFRDGSVPETGATTRVPGIWASVNGFSSRKESVTGVATLRLTLKVPSDGRHWSLRVPNANSALKVFASGKSIAEIGTVSTVKDSYLPSNGIAFPKFTASGNEIEFIMQIANFSTPYIGTWDSPILGSADAIVEKSRNDLINVAIISGALFIMGLYHLGLFFVRRKDYTTLVFGFICILMTVRNLLIGERLILPLFPATVGGWEWAFKVEHLSAHLTIPLFILFFWNLFPSQIKRLPAIVISCVGLAWAALTLLAPSMIYQRFLHSYEIFIVIVGVYLIVSISGAALKKERSAGIVLVGLFIMMFTVGNDVLFSIGVLSKTFYMASYGLFFYLFVQSIQLSMNFTNAFNDIEILSERLKVKNRELESLHAIDLAIASSMDLESILQLIMEEAVKELDVDAADILLLDADSETLSFASRIGFRTDALLHTRLRAGQGFAGQALLSEDAIFSSELDRNAKGFSKSPAFAAEGFVFYGGRRLTVKEKTVGVIELYRRTIFEPTESWTLFFKTLAGQAAIALDNADLLNGLRRANMELAEANDGTIESWAEALELRDRETEGHSRRVTEMTVTLASHFNITGPELDRVPSGRASP